MKKILLASLLTAFVCGYYSDFSKNNFDGTAKAAVNPSAGFANLVEKLSPAVVNISTSSMIASSPVDNFFGQGIPPEFRPFLENFLGGQFDEHLGKQSRKEEVKSLGSGFIIDPIGYIVTNHHVVDGADKIEINFPDGSNYKAKLIGSDAKTDLALLKIQGADKKFTYVSWGKSSQSRVGEWVVAIGNPYGLSGSVSAGIISAVNRDINSGPYDSFIQTDAAINRGNSGGPLFDMSGHVIGVNSAIISPSGGSVGVGFAIPSDLAQNVISQIQGKGKVERGRLGVNIQTLTKDIASSLGLANTQGALIGDVEVGGPAHKAGLKSGDVIIAVNGQMIKEMRDLPRMVAALPINQVAIIEYYRNGKRYETSIKVDKVSDQITQTAQAPGGGKIINDLGITIDTLTDVNRKNYRLPSDISGVIIEYNTGKVIEEFRPGDVILEIGQKPVFSADGFLKEFDHLRNQPNPVLFKIYRNGAVMYFAFRFK